MPESKGRPKSKSKKRGDVDPFKAERTANEANPPWFLPVMLGLMILGLVYIVLFYLVEGGNFPLPIGNWNLVVGLGIVMSGFIMSTNWR